MIILSADKVCLNFGEKVVLDQISFAVNQGDKMSIVGMNGAGKSSLMKILTGEIEPSSGSIFTAKGKTIGVLQQQLDFEPNITVYEAALNVFSSLVEQEKEIETITEQLTRDQSEQTIKRYTYLREIFEKNGGYEYKSKVKGTLIGIGFKEDQLSLPVSLLSGGQRSILQLSVLLLREPDILFLDEPTNHLDIRALEWLEDRLKRIKSTLIVISHDRLFLDRVTDKTLEIENTRSLYYQVPYSKFREIKKKEREIQERHYQNQQKEIARIESFIAQQKQWNREKNIIAAQSRQKSLDKMIKIERPDTPDELLKFKFDTCIESGNDVLTVNCLSKSYGDKCLFSDLSFELKKQERLLIIGPNGCGKSTLLGILADRIVQDKGDYRYGYHVKIGYYDQYQQLNDENTVLEEIWDDLTITQTQIRTLLAGFLFKGDDVFKKVKVLSGGERARLVLAKLMQKRVNLLILDEPTNHLDIESREVLEEAIQNFDGTVIAVSHDRYFINRIATELIDISSDGKSTVFRGSYCDYCNFRKNKEQEESLLVEPCASPLSSTNKWQEEKIKKQAERKKQNRMARIQEEIQKIEDRITQIDQLSLEKYSDYLLLQSLFEEKTKLEKRSDELYEEWSELEN